MVRKTLLAFTLVLLFSASCFGQLYPTQFRPPHQDWQQITTPHFTFIFAKENYKQALELGQVLESQYSKVQGVIGGELHNFPIILNNYNDRSNGFVTPFNFRSEIELPPIKGKSLNPQTGNWLANVGPHELVHALQFNNLGDYNIPRLVSLFSPDLARSFHGAIPPGMLEGIAVYYETKNITHHGGRGNYPFFTNQFEATFNSDKRWSMGQLFQASAYSRPFGRHYIGGYAFTNWLHNSYGEDITKKAIDFYLDFPFLGYGVALRHATGIWPGQLYNRFETEQQKRLQLSGNRSQFESLDIPYNGREIRRPKWLSDSEIIFYGSFYNARPGFYRYNLARQKMDRLITTNSVGDYRYTIAQDQDVMVFSYYKADPIYNRTATAELRQYNFSTHELNEVTQKGRLYAPAFSGDGLLAIKSYPVRSKLIALPDSNQHKELTLFSAPNHEIVSVASRTNHKDLAVVSNNNGQQALWIIKNDEVARQLHDAPDISFAGGSVFDPEWHPNKDRLLFSSDYSGTMQLYEYDLTQKEIVQLTNSPFNAFEGSYSPDGNRIAFIYQHKNERLPAIQERSEFLNRSINHALWQPDLTPNTPSITISDSVAEASNSWEAERYSPGFRWLRPRTVLPFFDEVSNQDKYRAGLSFHSVNALSTQAYSADISYFNERGWYDLSYRNRTFFPGFKTRVYSEPSYRFYENLGVLGRQERSAALSIPLRLRLHQNIYNSSLFIEPEFRRSQIRFWDSSFQNKISEFANLNIVNLYTRFGYRLQQNIRDLQPNSGFILFSEIEHYLGGDNISFSLNQNEITLTSSVETAIQGGIYTYLAPFKRWNQSLRMGIRGLSQSGFIFDNQSIVSDSFSGPIFPSSKNLLSFDTRYTIPLAYVDNGGLLLPFYLSNIYLVAFSNTVTDPNFKNWYKNSRTIFGIGLRANVQLSNLGINIGIGYGYEPSRNRGQLFIGDF